MEQVLSFENTHTTPAKMTHTQSIRTESSIGLKNIKKRLAIGSKKERYDLKIGEKKGRFLVNLKIKVK